ncbi:DUF2157 domain-containing protein [Leptospira sp. 201903070]|uniref:DUF2157 domain-containing protein n=1 Tax=Leptospira ainlahdjerensis TaxID=2810033 RepID=A0ABS2UEF9_9LEPT|nr:DUF2157 domain-containing protein [Leptospira ainlahdjerensis]MBM9578774.1 DUF2157 domain-containing protein [Leptospira ainlahdjerensis]
MRLEHKLKKWVEAGLIGTEQSESILRFEENKKTPYLYYSFLILGVVVIGIGIIAVIAANWEEISDFVKLGAALLVLTSIGTAGFLKRENPNLLTVLIVLNSILILGMIGLISQVYNLEGRYYEAAMLWCILNILFLISTDSKTFLHLWLVGFQIFLTGWIFEKEYSIQSFHWPEYFFLSTVGYFTLWLVSEKFSLDSRKGSFFFWAVLFLIAGSSYRGFVEKTPPEILEDLGWIHSVAGFPWLKLCFRLLALVPAGLLLVSNKDFSISQKKSLALSSVFLFFLYFPFPFQYVPITSILSYVWNYSISLIPALLFIFFWLGIASAFRSHKRIFDLSIAIIGIRFLYFYFDVFGSLTYTGFGLILSGLLIIGFTVGYLKYKTKVRNLLGGEE